MPLVPSYTEVSDGLGVAYAPRPDGSGVPPSYSAVSDGLGVVYPPGTAPGLPFISDWNTTNTSAGSSTSTQIALPLESSGTYDFTVDWGDGNDDVITVWNQAETTHTYAVSGAYTITITGTIDGFRFNNTGDRLKILDISQWGILKVGNSNSYFFGCSNLDVTATDTPDLSSTTDMSGFFRSCSLLVGSSSFDEWDVSNATNMVNVFNLAVIFNQSIDSWVVNGVTNMAGMFSNADAFNQSLDSWVVSAVTNMGTMFNSANVFNGNIASWDVGNVTNMTNMFKNADLFNQDIGSWDVSSVTNMTGVFDNADVFNQDIGSWVVSAATNMTSMFNNAVAFNQSLNSWNVSSVTNMTNMFLNAAAFNGNITSWTPTSVNSMAAMFSSADVFNQNIGSWDVSSATNMNTMFSNTGAFDQDIGSWDVSGVTNMTNMFLNVTLSTTNYDSLLIGWEALTLQNGVSFNGGGSQFSAGAAATARADIISNFSWTIVDGGQAP